MACRERTEKRGIRPGYFSPVFILFFYKKLKISFLHKFSNASWLAKRPFWWQKREEKRWEKPAKNRRECSKKYPEARSATSTGVQQGQKKSGARLRRFGFPYIISWKVSNQWSILLSRFACAVVVSDWQYKSAAGWFACKGQKTLFVEWLNSGKIWKIGISLIVFAFYRSNSQVLRCFKSMLWMWFVENFNTDKYLFFANFFCAGTNFRRQGHLHDPKGRPDGCYFTKK